MKPFVVIDAEQRSEAWRIARAGLVTASCAASVVGRRKDGKPLAEYYNYLTQLVAERLTGAPQDSAFVSAAMQRGTDLEPEAFATYEIVTGQRVSRVGFLMHNELPIGASPDGVIGDFEGLLELKVPLPTTHLAYVKAKALPAEYAPQVTHALLVSGAAYCDFMSYGPNFPEHLQTFIVRVKREDVDLAGYEKELRAFLAAVDREVEALRTVTDLTATLKAAVA